MKLVIVESPTKTHTLKRYLGDNYEVEASKGHIRDLSISGKNGYGVNLENNFEASYSIDKNKIKVIERLKEMAGKADEVILATDPDREGEAIAWHLADVLELPIESTKRLEFHEITRESILEAIEAPRTINMNLVESQETRRIIDRIIGFDLSKFAKKIIKSDSAGRVQSCTLGLICDHEKEILSFVPETYYAFTIKSKDGRHTLNFVSYNEQKFERMTDKKLSEEIIEKLGNSVKVTDISIKEKRIKSKQPFTTSTLQQEAFNKYGFSTKETQAVAQRLYEGVETPDGLVGLITYMRTDSTKLSNTYIERAKAFILEQYGEQYFDGAKDPMHNAAAQEAHEAIRPTSNHRTPNSLKDFLTKREYQLYSLIYNRAQSSLMSDEVDEVCTVKFESNGVELSLSGSRVVFDGFSVLYKEKTEKFDFNAFKVGDVLELGEKTIEEKQTTPPERYSEAKIVKLMEEKGIGRPSTYAATISTLIERLYITSHKGIIKPTDQGMLTADFLKTEFSGFMNVEYTAMMEQKLDEIEKDKSSRNSTLNDFYDNFTQEITAAKKVCEENPDKWKPIPPKETGEFCPECGSPLVERRSKYGKFVACSRYPECTYIQKTKKEVELVGRPCPECGKDLVYRTSKKGRFIACLGFPKCLYKENIDEKES